MPDEATTSVRSLLTLVGGQIVLGTIAKQLREAEQANHGPKRATATIPVA